MRLQIGVLLNRCRLFPSVVMPIIPPLRQGDKWNSSLHREKTVLRFDYCNDYLNPGAKNAFSWNQPSCITSCAVRLTWFWTRNYQLSWKVAFRDSGQLQNYS